MSLSLAQKQHFYYELGQSLHSGISFARALVQLSEDTRGPMKRFVEGLSAAVAKGDSVADAFARHRPDVTDLEISVLAGGERSGRLEQGCKYLASYFEAMVKSRATVVKGAAYPFLLLHLGIVVGPIKQIMEPGGFEGFAKTVGWHFLYFYVAAFVIFLFVRLLVSLARNSVFFDRILRLLPLFGKVRRAFSFGRFCGTYEMQLQSGVNVMDSLQHAGRASQSAVLREAVQNMLPKIRAGEQVGPLMAGTGEFTRKMIRGIRLGEETGKLDEELRRLTENFQEEAMARIATLSNWIGKILYIGIAVFVGYQVITFYAGTLSDALKQTE